MDMDDFGVLAREFGSIRPQGKSAPMAASKSSAPPLSYRSAAASQNSNRLRSGPIWSSSPPGEGITADRIAPSYDAIFGNRPPNSTSPHLIDSPFDGGYKDRLPKSSSTPVYDKPLYDDDVFGGVSRPRSSASSKYDDAFSSMGSVAESVKSFSYDDDHLERLGKGMRSCDKNDSNAYGFEELLPGFGGSGWPHKSQVPDENHQKPAKPTTSMPKDPLVVLQTQIHQSSPSHDDPFPISRFMSSGSTNINFGSVDRGVFDDFDGLRKSVPSYTSEIDESRKANSINANQYDSFVYNFSEKPQRSSVDAFENFTPKNQATRNSESKKSNGRHNSQKSTSNSYSRKQDFSSDQSSESQQHAEAVDDAWLTISKIKLFTKPTIDPPPSRPPPSIVDNRSPFVRTDEPASPALSGRRKHTDSFAQSKQSYSYSSDSMKRSNVSPTDELEDFSMAKSQRCPNEGAEVFSTEEVVNENLRDAMGRAETKFRHAKEVTGRERDAKAARGRAYMPPPDRIATTEESQDSKDKEKQKQLDWEYLRKEMKEKEEERMSEKVRELKLEQERERARQAVERATREVRERAAAEARLKAERAAAEKARQQAERVAFQRAAAEARERAANDARERVEKAKESSERAKAVAEAREKAATEAREKGAAVRAAAEAHQRAAERAAVERVAAEARDRAATQARERAAAAAREKLNKTENDFEAFFSMGSRASSEPKQRTTTSDSLFDAQFQSKGDTKTTRSSSSACNLNMKKASSATNIVDDLSSIFGAPQSSGEFQDIEGETEERRRARFERHQRTLERTAKALAEKNERDMQMQREQAERHRIAETLDFEIKRWASGKEGNLRALLSTLQYVLWPECGWQPVSLTDLITAAAVKKVYRKATLCIHPDKVQQKGATLQQKYIAEKVFDLLKEAWNKFNSEELF